MMWKELMWMTVFMGVAYAEEIKETTAVEGASGIATKNKNQESFGVGYGLGLPYGSVVGDGFYGGFDIVSFGGLGCGGGPCGEGPCSEGPCGEGPCGGGFFNDGLLYEGDFIGNNEGIVGDDLAVFGRRRLHGLYGRGYGVGPFGGPFVGGPFGVAAENDVRARAHLRNAAAKRCDATKFDRVRKRINDVAFKQAAAFRNKNAVLDATHFANKHAAAKVCADKKKAIAEDNEIIDGVF